MKKILLVALAIAVAFTFSSCKKDGVYNPKQKIAKVSTEWTSVQSYEDAAGSHTETTEVKPFVSQAWNWADKTLESIVNYERVVNPLTNSVSFVDTKTTYTYDDKDRISGMKYGDHSVEFVYNDDKKMSKITTKDGAELESTIEFAYDGKLVSSIDVIYYKDYKKCAANLAKVLPSPIMRSIELAMPTETAKDVHIEKTNVVLEWDGKNIAQTVTTTDHKTVTTTYEYDGKLNPFKGMYANVDEGFDFFSKNNVLKATNSSVVKDGNETIERKTVDEYSYEYDGKYPTAVTYRYEYEHNFAGTTYITVTTTKTTYDYVD